ncbi:MAG: phenylalanine--tRNA ligase subunit alpha [Gemmatimonadetes bacterium]|nr:phenylalanine--tRNA ligase subunit alpha [Gemmatimonadota bacterium]MXX73455.1 phenylalanine--tRNA ligase subunit alpha [Gemmatimonadota bacterium]MYC92190.1 phenylalanine--tRNA ligase subunit alpha [Gemmatimonadota bacterium]MYG35823.1 phenylalanine--tRNA ligase subunit alpha [Gemmatimonadota bacterium]MYJ18027.1 phenylalanine--tRNA ligase subunit alpha [Gemmatimonadota bacterium]
MIDELRRLREEALDAFAKARDAGELERLRVRYLGRKDGLISGVLRRLGSLNPQERPSVGAAANRAKKLLAEALQDRLGEVTAARSATERALDLTLPPRRKWRGTIHPVSQVIDDIWRIFQGLGFARARGPEVDTEWYNFVALNTPLDHPAADEQDTLYLAPGLLLRSHTSPVQIRTMERYPPPIRIMAPGMVYRRDTYDATHTPAFAQIEGLVVDEGVTFVDFKATLAEFARRFWGPGTQVRFRPSFFPFTEPSAEVDVKRVIVRENGREEETDWIEIMGAGMVDPAVLDNVGYDSERYTGWAFGMGPARVAMLRHGVRDLRLFYENDMRFLGQFT